MVEMFQFLLVLLLWKCMANVLQQSKRMRVEAIGTQRKKSTTNLKMEKKTLV